MADNPIQPVQISRETFEHKSMDYAYLRAEGLRLVQLLSGEIWTDYNPHDPGITILEQLCFAMTDLGYRTDFSIQDLLNARSRRRRKELNNTFYDASEALPTNPVGMDDYRRLIIDRVQGVRNAWIEVVKDNLQGIRGLYRVHLQLKDQAARTPQLIEQTKQAVAAVFHQHRNLGEDLDSIHILGKEPIVVFAELDIAPETIAEEVLANILFKIEEYLNPTIQFYNVEELQEQGYTVDQIFDGPVPVHGFIRQEDLGPVRREIYVSKLIELISGTEGVRRINYMRVEKDGFPVEGDVVRIENGCYPVLDLDPINDKYADVNRYPVQFYRGSIRADLDLNTTNQLYATLSARYRKGYELEMLYKEHEYPSILKEEEIRQYYSVQNFFPITYGLNRYGLPTNVRPTRERLIMIKQLKGYLLFFEQLLANYLAQLGSLKELFSINENIDRTYFSQIPEDIGGLMDLLDVPIRSTIQETIEEFRPKLEKIVAEFDPFIDRRNRFLDHLLARFGEQFPFQGKVLDSGASGEDADRQLIGAKIALLRHWIEMSRNRSRAFDYMDDLDGWNVSGLEKRVCLSLNIQQRSNLSLFRAFFEADEQTGWKAFDAWVDTVPPDTAEGKLDMDKLQTLEAERARQELQRREQKDGDEQTPQNTPAPIEDALPDETETLDYTGRLLFRASDRDALLFNLFAHALHSHNYLLLKNRKGGVSIYYRGNRELGVYKIWEGENYRAAQERLHDWLHYLRALNAKMEGFHLVEHILLRSQAKDRHGFRLINDQDNVLLVSYELGDLDEQRHIAADLEELGKDRQYYKVVEQINQTFQIVLVNNFGKPIALCPEPIYTEEGAEEKIDDLLEHFQSFEDSRVPISNFISFFMEQRKENNVGQQFFSFNLSVVAPRFLARFQTEDFQNLLRHQFSVHVPVHLHINFYWLSFEQMQNFEKHYFDWLSERARISPEQPALDDKAGELIRLLTEYDKTTQ